MALKAISEPDPSPYHACWLCQQSAEKALKVSLVFEGIAFPRTYDLDVLKNLLSKGWAMHDAHSDLSDLSEWAIDARYPGTWPEPTNADAIVAKSKASSIYDSVEGEFRCRGVII